MTLPNLAEFTAESINGTCCDSLQVRTWERNKAKKYGPVSIAVGDVTGTCCIIEDGVPTDKPIQIYSASKILTGYTFLRLIQAGRVTLQTRAAEVLDWWGAEGGGCHNLTVFHLLTQTGSLHTFKRGLGQCSAGTTEGCAKKAYKEACADRPLGSGFEYGETNFYVLGAIALKVTALPTYNAVFRQYLGDYLGMSPKCEFKWPTVQQVDPGGGCWCTIRDYARFLRAALADEIVPVSLRRQAELPHTLLMGVDMRHAIDVGQQNNWHYGLGQWRECADDDKRPGQAQPCPDSTGVKVSSIGIAGYYPYMWRNGEESHWGLVARVTGTLPASVAIGRETMTRAVQVMNQRYGHTGSELQGEPATFQGLEHVGTFLFPLAEAFTLVALPFTVVFSALRWARRFSKFADESGSSRYTPSAQKVDKEEDLDQETTSLFAIA